MSYDGSYVWRVRQKVGDGRILNDRGIPNPTEYKRLNRTSLFTAERDNRHFMEVFCDF